MSRGEVCLSQACALNCCCSSCSGSPPTPCLGTAWAAPRRGIQGHCHGYYNYILDGIPKFPFIYIPTLPSSFPLFVPRISTEFTGNCMKVIRSPSGLAFISACPEDGKRGPAGHPASGPRMLQGLGRHGISPLEACVSPFAGEGWSGSTPKNV